MKREANKKPEDSGRKWGEVQNEPVIYADSVHVWQSAKTYLEWFRTIKPALLTTKPSLYGLTGCLQLSIGLIELFPLGAVLGFAGRVFRSGSGQSRGQSRTVADGSFAMFDLLFKALLEHMAFPSITIRSWLKSACPISGREIELISNLHQAKDCSRHHAPVLPTMLQVVYSPATGSERLFSTPTSHSRSKCL